MNYHWDQRNYDDIDNMTTYLSAAMFKTRIDPNAQAHPASIQQYEKNDVDPKVEAKEKSPSKENEATNGEERDDEKEEATDAKNEDAAPQVKKEAHVPSATLATANPGVATAAVPAGVPTGVPTALTNPTPAAASEQTIEETGEVSMLYVGRVIGKGGEVSQTVCSFMIRKFGSQYPISFTIVHSIR
jgi:hypothetical protein